MRMKLEPSHLRGTIRAVTSKSAAHRSLICAALSDRETELRISDRSVDIDATMDCLRAMGADICVDGEICRVLPLWNRAPGNAVDQPRQGSKRGASADGDAQSLGYGEGPAVLNCRESGSTLRFLLPVAAAACACARMDGEGRLPQRPLGPLARVLEEHGVTLKPLGDESLPLLVSGKPRSGTYKIEGNISSQYISGLLFALPLLEGDSRIELFTPMESSAYVDMTLEALSSYGIHVEQGRSGFLVPGRQTYRSPGVAKVEGDWSNAAFFLAAGALGAGGITCGGLKLESAQGDRAMLDLLRRFGADVVRAEPGDKEELGSAAGGSNLNVGDGRSDPGMGDEKSADAVTVGPGSLSGQDIDVSQIPDLMPILAITACGAQGKTVLRGAGRLRIKESDRIAATAALINGLGGRAEEGPDSLTVYGTGGLKGGRASSFGDHRIAMCAAIAALICTGPVYLEQAEAVNKSYPNFFRDYNALGGKADVI